MAYAALELSVRLLDGQDAPAASLRLSRRVRHLAVAVDRDGDAAATMFLRRGVGGEAIIDVHALERRAGVWRLLGGGGGTAHDAVFGERPRLSGGATLAEDLGSGGTVLGGRRLVPWGARWVRWDELRLAAEVATLRVGSRLVPVAPHGVAMVVWRSRQRPRVVALDAQAAELGPVGAPER